MKVRHKIMPNYCENCLSIEGNTAMVNRVLNFVKSMEKDFDFERIIPMPDYISQVPVDTKEREMYGENNWYDWSIKNWGTKWNSIDPEVDGNDIRFYTAWSPCEPVIAALAKKFPDVGFTYTFCEPGQSFCGGRIYENGKMIFYYDGDYKENYLCEEDDELAEGYTITDTMFPIVDSGIREEIQAVEESDHCICGKLFYREYENSKIKFLSDGYFVAIKGYKFPFPTEIN